MMSAMQYDVSLQKLNTLSVPSVAKAFIEVHTQAELRSALMQAKNLSLPPLVLGGGSNVVFPEELDACVIAMRTRGITIEQETDENVTLSVAAGENWHDLVMYCVSQQWYGIENLALIPGTVGAAPIQNIGAYGVELCSCIEYVQVMHVDTGNIQQFSKAQCEFSYRDSVFKKGLKDTCVITQVTLTLSKKPCYRLEYPALQEALSTVDEPTITDVCQAVITLRKSKLPDPYELPNAGSFFKNPIVTIEQYLKLQEQYPTLVAYEVDSEHYKLAAGWLIDQAGWKGKVLNTISMHKQQALVLTNPRRCAKDVLISFIRVLQHDIKAQYGVELEVEPRIY